MYAASSFVGDVVCICGKAYLMDLEDLEFQAINRDLFGKGAARALRRQGFIPAVIYGNKLHSSLHVALSFREVSRRLHLLKPSSNVLSLLLDGDKVMVVPQDCQFDRLRGFPIHLDFIRVSGAESVKVRVPIRLTGADTSLGSKKGGVLSQDLEALDLTCTGDAIPKDLKLDVASLDVGEVIRVADMDLPEGVACSHDPSATVVSISKPDSVIDGSMEEHSEEVS